MRQTFMVRTIILI